MVARGPSNREPWRPRLQERVHLDEPTAVERIARVSTDVREQTQAMRTADEAQDFVDEVMRLIRESPIQVRVIDR